MVAAVGFVEKVVYSILRGKGYIVCFVAVRYVYRNLLMVDSRIAY